MNLIIPLISLLVTLFFCCHAKSADEEFCSANEPGICDGKSEGTMMIPTSEASRYLLYDVNPPEGFNLRRDVYMRIAIFVKHMQKHGNWTLVLPPWGQLYHWQSSNVGKQVRLPWRMFFDTHSLKKFAPVIEMDEFFQTNSKRMPIIDEVYVLQHYKDMWEEGREWREQWDIEPCINEIPYTATGKVFKGPFWHYSNVTAKKVSCVSFQGHISLLKKLLSLTKSRSIVVDHAEVALHDTYGDKEYWEARRSMRFAPHLVKIAKDFRKEHLQSTDEADGTIRPVDWQEEKEQRNTIGGPYLAVHLRRKDFLWGRSKEVPDLKYAAAQLEELMKKHQLTTVFIASDAPKVEFAELKSYLPNFKVLRFEPSPTMKYEIKDGGVAIVDQILCSHAKIFTGTYESTFSFRIQEEREILGFLRNTTFNRLCGRQEGIPCSQPTQWQIVY